MKNRSFELQETYSQMLVNGTPEEQEAARRRWFNEYTRSDKNTPKSGKSVFNTSDMASRSGQLSLAAIEATQRGTRPASLDEIEEVLRSWGDNGNLWKDRRNHYTYYMDEQGWATFDKTNNTLTLTENGKVLASSSNLVADLPIPADPTADFEEYIRLADQILARGNVSRPSGSVSPIVENTSSTQFYRDPKVRAWVLQRAKGHCELCDSPAPFLTDHDEAYLESHHIILLAESGPDTPENTSALCPNCHRKMHYSQDRVELRHRLQRIVLAKEAPYV